VQGLIYMGLVPDATTYIEACSFVTTSILQDFILNKKMYTFFARDMVAFIITIIICSS
jgi:hypothetical protein